MSLPRSMRVARNANGAHYYINPATIEIYPKHDAPRVRLTRRQLEQALEVMRRAKAR
jgi:hypothetical protein